ncbi:MAG: glycosyltransferase family 39 protein [Anaerolineae bacterium]|nr:glycosyltransferase family 39 protein [Cyanobacteriota bacterium]MDW8172731.1 glycosyltransferase family 39 protein [Anaerolineae bacterium]
MSKTAEKRLVQFGVYIVLLGCFFTYFQEFKDRPYRQDEALVANWAEQGNVISASESIMHTSAQPGWFIAFDLWIDILGSQEIVSRAFAHLIMLTTLAVTYQIGKNFGRPQIGFYSMLLLGTWPIFAFYGNELRHYAALYLGCTTLFLATLRWLDRPLPRHIILVILGGGLAMLSHLYGYYVVIGIGAAALLLGQHRNRHFWIGLLTIVAGLAMVACIWLVPNLYVFLFLSGSPALQGIQNDVRDIASWQEILNNLALNPPSATLLLLIPGLFIGLEQIISKKDRSRRQIVYLFVSISVIATLIYLVNLFVVEQFHSRYVTVVLIWLAPVGAIALGHLKRLFRLTLLVILLIGFFNDSRVFNGTGPYLEMVDFISAYESPDALYISDAITGWEHWTSNYYIQNRLTQQVSSDQILFLTAEGPTQRSEMRALQPPPSHLYFTTASDQSFHEPILQFTAQEKQVWRIVGSYGPAETSWLDIFKRYYILHRQRHWDAHEGINALTVEEYRRIPDDMYPIAQANELILMHWQLKLEGEAKPCKTVNLDSWWQADAVPAANYSLSLALVGQDGQGVSQHGGGISPTLSGQWIIDSPYLDERNLLIPCDLAPGTYPIVFALYDSETLANVIFTTPEGVPIGRNLFLTQITVGTP